MKARKGMVYKATFSVDGKFEDVELHGHVGQSIESYKRVLALINRVKKSEVILMERWQEPIKEEC